jgi:hypothetical protein
VWDGAGRGQRLAANVAACPTAAASSRVERATRNAHRLALEVKALRGQGVTTNAGIARALTDRGIPTPRGGAVWTHTTVARVIEELGA